ncbi:MAG: CapA family protein [Bdellovibrionaceae bacterium]|nr:CapA family protein [Pseudobdellovibrionaceae bacterium]
MIDIDNVLTKARMKSFIFAVSFIVFSSLAHAQSGISITAVGDIMMGTDFPTDRLPSDKGGSLFKYSAERISAGDIRFGNFEGTFFDGNRGAGSKSPGPNRYIFRTPTDFGPALAAAGFNVVSLANNHAMDFGSQGLGATKATLTKNQIQFSSKNGGEVAQFNVRGIRVALIATDFYNGARSITTPQTTYLEIAELKKTYDIVIVSCHAGREGAGAERTRDVAEIFSGENRGNSVEFSRKAIDAGASLIIMHGPHVPRGYEVYKGHLIAYSLGNFLTEAGISVTGISGLAPLLQVNLDAQGKFVRGYVTSFRQVRDKGTVYDSSQAAYTFMKDLSLRDFPGSAPRFEKDGLFYPQ